MHPVFAHCGNSFWPDWILNLTGEFSADPQAVIQYSAIIAGFISITVPIALDIISKNSQDFKDKEMSEVFPQHWLYWFQLYVNLAIAFGSILLLALGVKSGAWMIVIIVLDCIAIIVFILFMRLVQRFATDFSGYYSEKLKKRANDIVQGK